MATPENGFARIERAIYVVSSLIFLLAGVQTLSVVGLDIYDRYTGLALPTDLHAWVGWGVTIFLGLLELGAGLFLAYLAMRAHRSSKL